MSAETLYRAFKTLADPTRVRILALLEREELAVQEVMDVLAMPQSRVSRHLGILRQAGLLRGRREGTHALYRFRKPRDTAWRGAWELARDSLRGDPLAQRDARALVRVVEERATRSRSFFDAIGPGWDALRTVFNDEALRSRAISQLIEPGLRVADVGTGTGILAAELARLGARVIGVDHSPRMLETARNKLEAEGLGGVEWRGGEAHALPMADAEVSAAFAHMVLHYVSVPALAVRELARVVQPGGRVVVVDFVAHNAAWMRSELGVLWLGFAPSQVEQWMTEAGLGELRLERFAASPSPRTLPEAFLCSARRPLLDP